MTYFTKSIKNISWISLHLNNLAVILIIPGKQHRPAIVPSIIQSYL